MMDEQKKYKKTKLDKNDHKIMEKVVSGGKKVLGVGGTIAMLALMVVTKTDKNPFDRKS